MWLRQHLWALAAMAVVVAFFAWLSVSAIEDSRERRRARDNIEALAGDIKAIAEEIRAQGDRIESATSEESRAASNERLAGAIAEIRRSIYCAALYALGERPPACADVGRHMDAIRAGADPFARPSSG